MAGCEYIGNLHLVGTDGPGQQPNVECVNCCDSNRPLTIHPGDAVWDAVFRKAHWSSQYDGDPDVIQRRKESLELVCRSPSRTVNEEGGGYTIRCKDGWVSRVGGPAGEYFYGNQEKCMRPFPYCHRCNWEYAQLVECENSHWYDHTDVINCAYGSGEMIKGGQCGTGLRCSDDSGLPIDVACPEGDLKYYCKPMDEYSSERWHDGCEEHYQWWLEDTGWGDLGATGPYSSVTECETACDLRWCIKKQADASTGECFEPAGMTADLNGARTIPVVPDSLISRFGAGYSIFGPYTVDLCETICGSAIQPEDPDEEGGGGGCSLSYPFIAQTHWKPKKSACHSACDINSLWAMETFPISGDSAPLWEVSEGSSKIKYTAADSEDCGGKGSQIQTGKAARMFHAEEDFFLTVRMVTNHEGRIDHDMAGFKIHEVAACCTGVCDPICRGPEKCCTKINAVTNTADPNGTKVGVFLRWKGKDGKFNCPCGYAQDDPASMTLVEGIIHEFVSQLREGSVDVLYFINTYSVNPIEFFAGILGQADNLGFLTLENDTIIVNGLGIQHMSELLELFSIDLSAQKPIGSEILFSKGDSELECGPWAAMACAADPTLPNCFDWRACLISNGRWRCGESAIAAGGCHCECVEEMCALTDPVEVCDNFMECKGCSKGCGCECKEWPSVGSGAWVPFDKVYNGSGQCVFPPTPRTRVSYSSEAECECEACGDGCEEPRPPEVELVGACCLHSAIGLECVGNLTSGACAASGGVFMGAGLTCGDTRFCTSPPVSPPIRPSDECYFYFSAVTCPTVVNPEPGRIDFRICDNRCDGCFFPYGDGDIMNATAVKVLMGGMEICVSPQQLDAEGFGIKRLTERPSSFPAGGAGGSAAPEAYDDGVRRVFNPAGCSACYNWVD